MRVTGFCYWLQGYFEIRREKEPLSFWQIGIINTHIKLVKKHEGRNYPGSFPSWLATVLEVETAGGPQSLSPKIQELVEKKLAQTFKHEIDGTYPDSNGLDEIHGGGGIFPSGDVVYRC